jgi:glycogen synthase
LADVVAGLPRALARLGHQVDVVMPRYRGVDAPSNSSRLAVSLSGEILDAGVAEDVRDGIRTILLDYPPYFDRDYHVADCQV